jgi:hypothetical protein
MNSSTFSSAPTRLAYRSTAWPGPARSSHSTRSPIGWPKLDAAGWFLVLGLALRLVHYVWNHTIWYDEAALLFNILDKDYLRLLGPLDYRVAAPPLFLWGLRAIFELFGDQSYVWRLGPFLLGCLTLVLTTVLARRLLRPAAAALLVALVAFSDAFVWLGSNVKPYILDAFLATSIFYLWLKTENWTPVRRILLFTAAAPLLLCFSYPTLYVYAGLFLAFLPTLWRQRQLGAWAAYLGMVAVVLATFACLYFGPIHAQRIPTLVDEWKHKFPNLSQPLSIPGWVAGNTLLVFHYSYNPIGMICVLFVGAGTWWCLKNRRLDLACLCLGPVAACLVAAFLQIYPFSGNRLMLFAAPGIGLMSGLGFAAVLDLSGRYSRQVLAGMVAILILPEAVWSCAHLVAPWDVPDSVGATRFVREHCQSGEWLASDDCSYTYAFYGEARSLDDIAHLPSGPGQKVWVLMEHYTPKYRRAHVLAHIGSAGWEVQQEFVFHRAGAMVLIRRQGWQPEQIPLQ